MQYKQFPGRRISGHFNSGNILFPSLPGDAEIMGKKDRLIEGYICLA